MVKAAQRMMPRLEAEESLRTAAQIAVALGAAPELRTAWQRRVAGTSEAKKPIARTAADVEAAGFKVFSPKVRT